MHYVYVAYDRIKSNVWCATIIVAKPKDIVKRKYKYTKIRRGQFRTFVKGILVMWTLHMLGDIFLQVNMSLLQYDRNSNKNAKCHSSQA